MATAQIPQRLTCQAALHFTGTGLLNYPALSSQSPVTLAGTEHAVLSWPNCSEVTWRHNQNCHCCQNLTPPIQIVLLSWPRQLEAMGTDPGTTRYDGSVFLRSVSEYLHRRDVLIPCKHHSITSIVIIITDTLKTEINFNYVAYKHPVRTAQ